MNYRKKNYTKEECKEIFSKCKNRTEFRDKYRQIYLQSYKNGWIDEFIKSKKMKNK